MDYTKHKKTIIAGFDSFLNFPVNSSREVVAGVPYRNGMSKRILPVGYFKRDFARIRDENADVIIVVGMDDKISEPRFEIVARNEYVTIRNPLIRFCANVYAHTLKIFGKNLRVKKEFPPSKLISLPIDKNAPEKITLRSKIQPRLLPISQDAGSFVCNYVMWITETKLREKRAITKFYFIHVPANLSAIQVRKVVSVINALVK